MSQYIARRVLLIIPALVGVSLLITALTRLLPGDAVDIMLNEQVSSQGPAAFKEEVNAQLEESGVDPLTASFDQRAAAREDVIVPKLRSMGIDPNNATDAEKQQAENEMGLELFKNEVRSDLGLDKNYIEQWWAWTSSAVRGDFGTTLIGDRSINDELQRRVPTSLELGVIAMVFAGLVGLPVGVISAVKQDTWTDYIARSGAIAMLALPSFFVAILVIALSARFFGYSFPVGYEHIWENPRTNLELVVVPAMILGAFLAGSIMRLARGEMLEVMRQDFVRTARSKGLANRVVVLRHAVRNAFIPVITIWGLQVRVVIGGSVVIEVIFGIPGVAQYLLQAIQQRDFPVIIAVNVIVALAVMIANLLVDVTYAYLDPRVRFA